MRLERDAIDPERGERLAVAPRAAVVLPLLVLENADLRPAAGLDDGRRDLGPGEQRRPELRRFVIAPDEEDLAEGHGLADRSLKALHVDRLAFRHPVLLAAGPDDRV